MAAKTWLVVTLLLFAVGAAGAETTADEPTIDNVVVVMIDTLRSDHLSAYGYERKTTPFLSRVAEEGIQLQGYSATPWTRPSVATFLTGLYPQSHQAFTRTDNLPASVAFLPAILQEQGIDTRAYLSNGNAGSEVGFARGFDKTSEYSAGVKPKARLVTDAALELVDGVDGRFFLYVHYLDPHDPYVPEAVWGAPDRDPKSYLQPTDFLQKKHPMDSPQMQMMRDQYDGEIAEMDGQLERLLRELGEKGLLERTLVVITSDHGEAFGEHGAVAHGSSLHEELVRVPFLLWMKEGLPRYKAEAAFHHVDFVPTVLDALDLETPAGLDGESRWAEIQKGAVASRARFFHVDLDGHGEIGALAWPRKLIHSVTRKNSMVFDLEVDPEEASPARADTGAGQTLLAETVRTHNRLGERAAGRREVEPSEDLLRRLEALGYVDDDTDQESLARRVVPEKIELKAPSRKPKRGYGSR